MVRDDLAGKPDGQPLRTTSNGLQIVRYRKHDPARGRQQGGPSIRRRQGEKVSVFLPSWGIERYVTWIAKMLDGLGWSAGFRGRVDTKLDEPTGWVDDQIVHTIRISSDGRYVHAYPVKD